MAAAAVNDSSSEINVVIIGETGTGRNLNIEDIFRNLEWVFYVDKCYLTILDYYSNKSLTTLVRIVNLVEKVLLSGVSEQKLKNQNILLSQNQKLIRKDIFLLTSSYDVNIRA